MVKEVDLIIQPYIYMLKNIMHIIEIPTLNSWINGISMNGRHTLPIIIETPYLPIGGLGGRFDNTATLYDIFICSKILWILLKFLPRSLNKRNINEW